MILEKRRFATIASSGMECSWKLAGGSELLRQLCVQCNSFQVSLPSTLRPFIR